MEAAKAYFFFAILANCREKRDGIVCQEESQGGQLGQAA